MTRFHKEGGKKTFSFLAYLQFNLKSRLNPEAAFLWKKAKHYEAELFSASGEKLAHPGFWYEHTDKETDKLHIMGEKDYPHLNQRLMAWTPDPKGRTRTFSVHKVTYLKGFSYKDLCVQRMSAYRTQVHNLVRVSLPPLPKANSRGMSLF